MKSDYDLVVIGAGPAGLAGATQAASLGLGVLLLDEQPAPGGQIYRGIEQVCANRTGDLPALGRDYVRGAQLVEAMRRASIDYLAGATVWDVSRELTVHFSLGQGSRSVTARHILVATGAIERPVPVPGWTLPGVMTAGAVQILFKSAGLVSDPPLVLAGSGPLLWLLGQQLVAAGSPPAAIVETVPTDRYPAALRYLPKALRAMGYLRKGLALMRAVRKAGVPIHRGATDLAIEGTDRAEALRFRRGGREQRLEAGLVALHEGVVPNQQITRLVGATHVWDAAQQCFRPRLDHWLMTDVEGISVAGDGGGIGGARAAEHRGRLAALGITHRLGVLDASERDARASGDRTALARDLSARPLLDALYAPPGAILDPPDEVIVCRCEEVTAGQIRAAVSMGCPGPNQTKSYLRCGMGPCQGRLCGPTVNGIIACARREPSEAIGYYRIRPPLKPLTLGELAALDEEGPAPTTE